MTRLFAFASALISTAVFAQTAPVAAPPDVAVAPASAPALPGPVQSIRDARDPSQAINSYAQALTWANGRADDVVLVENTYVQQMIAFGVPEMAEVQAQDLITRDPRNGVAWAVAAHIAAKRNDPNAALSQIVAAFDRSPNDPFVLRTAGQILAWYDARADQSQVTAPVKNAVLRIREPLKNQQGFADAYDQATSFYRSQDQQPTGQATATDQPPQAPVSQPPSGYDTGDVSGGYSQPVTQYPSDYYTPTYTTYNYYYPGYSYYGTPYWCPDYGYGSYFAVGYGSYGYWRPYSYSDWRRHDRFFHPIAPRWRDNDFDHRRDISRRDPVARDRFDRDDNRGRFFDASSDNNSAQRPAPSPPSRNVRPSDSSSGRDRFPAPRQTPRAQPDARDSSNDTPRITTGKVVVPQRDSGSSGGSASRPPPPRGDSGSASSSSGRGRFDAPPSRSSPPPSADRGSSSGSSRSGGSASSGSSSRGGSDSGSRGSSGGSSSSSGGSRGSSNSSGSNGRSR
jgi:hypothetical protein